MTRVVLIALAATVVVYLLIALALFVAGRRTEARALAGFIPDCIVLFKRLLYGDNLPDNFLVFDNVNNLTSSHTTQIFAEMPLQFTDAYFHLFHGELLL